MATVDLPLDALTRFGIVPADDAPHAWSPEHEWWNESFFWDWFDATGSRAGHVRLGWFPNQGRFWLWCLLYEDGEWLVLEQPRLPLAELRLPDLAYEGRGLSVSYDVLDPLRAGRLRVSGFGRVLRGPRAGQVLPLGVDLSVQAAGPPYSHGAANVPGHSAEGYAANRFEQPIHVRGAIAFGAGDGGTPFEGEGERDHSWGPRDWGMEWTFFAIQGPAFRLQWAHADVPGVGRITVGYRLDADGAVSEVADVEARLVLAPAHVDHPVAGWFSARARDGQVVAGRVESLAGAEIDLSHCLVPPRATAYRRALVRFTPEGDGGGPALGWMELHRFDREAVA
jgi:hypothetical protein